MVFSHVVQYIIWYNDLKDLLLYILYIAKQAWQNLGFAISEQPFNSYIWKCKFLCKWHLLCLDAASSDCHVHIVNSCQGLKMQLRAGQRVRVLAVSMQTFAMGMDWGLLTLLLLLLRLTLLPVRAVSCMTAAAAASITAFIFIVWKNLM